MHTTSNEEDLRLATLLGQRYGDGLVYLQDSRDRHTLRHAISIGLISREGYLTPAGHRFWLRLEENCRTPVVTPRETRVGWPA